jgi:NAD-dependent SIR2 family protein deacetylase
VVWFSDKLPEDLLSRNEEWLEDVPRLDLLLVVGTSLRVFPAAELARSKGAAVAHFNMEKMRTSLW